MKKNKKSFFVNFLKQLNAIKYFKNRLREEMIRNRALGSELASLRKFHEEHTKNANDESNKYYVECLVTWLRDIIDDFEKAPYKDKLVGNWGYQSELGNINWTYIFEDKNRSWNLLSNNKLKDASSITMQDINSNSNLILIIKDSVLIEIVKFFNGINDKAIKRPDLLQESSDINDKDLLKELDIALETRDFVKVEFLRKELENKKKYKK